MWTIWELTTGFLIMGIPAFPRAFKALPGSEAIITFFQSLTSNKDLSKSMPWRYMYKPKTRRRRSVFEISDMDTQEMNTVLSAEMVHTVSHDTMEPKSNVTVSQDSVDLEPSRDVEAQQLGTAR